jgi:hypothetical protein
VHQRSVSHVVSAQSCAYLRTSYRGQTNIRQLEEDHLGDGGQPPFLIQTTGKMSPRRCARLWVQEVVVVVFFLVPSCCRYDDHSRCHWTATAGGCLLVGRTFLRAQLVRMMNLCSRRHCSHCRSVAMGILGVCQSQVVSCLTRTRITLSTITHPLPSQMLS